MLTPAPGERALATFEDELRISRGNRSYAFVRTERFLTEMAAREHHLRTIGFWACEGAALLMAGAGALSIAMPSDDVDNHAIGPAILFSEALLFSSLAS